MKTLGPSLVLAVAALALVGNSLAASPGWLETGTSLSKQKQDVMSSPSSSQDDRIGSFAATALGPANNEQPFASMINSAVLNGMVSLACDISPASADDSVALVLWYKDDSRAPIYTLDARKESSLDRAKISLDEAYTTRARFSFASKPAQLQLERIQLDDEGEYRCRVDFKRGRTVNTIIALRVFVPPSELYIALAARPSQHLSGLVGPFDEGAELALVCVALGGKPRPEVSWRRDFNVIDDTFQHLDKDATSNELKISSLSRSHLLSMFTCQANNTNTGQPLKSSITLDLNLKPQEISLRQLGHEPLLAGQTATFECLALGSRPQAAIHWLFQGARHEPPTTVDQQRSSSRLQLKLDVDHNQQPLTCVADNPRMLAASGHALRQNLKLDVHYAPQLSIRLESSAESAIQLTDAPSDATLDKPASQHHLVQEGNDVYLSCQLSANPRPAKAILWRFNGRPLASSSQHHQLQHHFPSSPSIVINNQALVLRKVSRSQAGQYTCEAANQYGSNSSEPLELAVRHAPVCATSDVLVLEASLGQTLALDCAVLASPSQSVQFSWFKAPGSPANLTDWIKRDVAFDEQVDHSSSSLIIKVKDRNSLGLFKCKAKNEIGLQQRACLFQLVESRAPKLRHQCELIQASPISPNSLQLECKPSEHLKSEDFELVAAASSDATPASSSSAPGTAASAMSDWLGLAAASPGAWPSQPPSDEPQSKQHSVSLRLVYPPEWLLAELYKLPSAPSGEPELVAYVIVASGSQLAQIKSLIETSKVFSAQPRSVYYVMTKPISGPARNGLAGSANLQQANSGNTTTATNMTFGLADWFQQSGRQKDSAASEIAPVAKHHHHGLLIGGQIVHTDPAIKLAAEFSFTVPNLDSASKYKLLIFGQNLANKTRDWLVVRGETGPDRDLGWPKSSGSSLDSNSNSISSSVSPSKSSWLRADLQAGSSEQPQDPDREPLAAPEEAQSQASGARRQQTKSIVMRSGENTDHSAAEQQQQASSKQQQLEPSANSPHWTSLVGSPYAFARHLGAQLPAIGGQLELYKERAMAVARQRPLVAAPVALVAGLLVLMLLARLSSRLVGLVGAHSDSASDDSSENAKQRRGSEENSVASSNSSSRGSKAMAKPESQQTSQPLDGQHQLQPNGKLMLLASPEASYSGVSQVSADCGSVAGSQVTSATRFASLNPIELEHGELCNAPAVYALAGGTALISAQDLESLQLEALIQNSQTLWPAATADVLDAQQVSGQQASHQQVFPHHQLQLHGGQLDSSFQLARNHHKLKQQQHLQAFQQQQQPHRHGSLDRRVSWRSQLLDESRLHLDSAAGQQPQPHQDVYVTLSGPRSTLKGGQRVAFDLPAASWQADEATNLAAARYHVCGRAEALKEFQSQQQQHHLEHHDGRQVCVMSASPRPLGDQLSGLAGFECSASAKARNRKCANHLALRGHNGASSAALTKGSDSSGTSQSGQTGDSGHESPQNQEDASQQVQLFALLEHQHGGQQLQLQQQQVNNSLDSSNTCSNTCSPASEQFAAPSAQLESMLGSSKRKSHYHQHQQDQQFGSNSQPKQQQQQQAALSVVGRMLEIDSPRQDQRQQTLEVNKSLNDNHRMATSFSTTLGSELNQHRTSSSLASCCTTIGDPMSPDIFAEAGEHDKICINGDKTLTRRDEPNIRTHDHHSVQETSWF